MSLSEFPITKRWPPKHPDRLQLYSLTTPNGVKVSIMLEETGLPYEAHYIDFGKKDQKTPEYLSLNPNGKIPAIIDPNGPDGKPVALYESGAILLYLADKTGKLLPADPIRRWETIQWVFWQMAFVGPMFGQVGYFKKFEGRHIEDKRPLQHYASEARRLLGLMETRLEGRAWIMGGRVHNRRHFAARHGAQLHQLLRSWRAGRIRRADRMCRPGLHADWRGQPSSAASQFQQSRSHKDSWPNDSLALCR